MGRMGSHRNTATKDVPCLQEKTGLFSIYKGFWMGNWYPAEFLTCYACPSSLQLIHLAWGIVPGCRSVPPQSQRAALTFLRQEGKGCTNPLFMQRRRSGFPGLCCPEMAACPLPSLLLGRQHHCPRWVWLACSLPAPSHLDTLWMKRHRVIADLKTCAGLGKARWGQYNQCHLQVCVWRV